MKTDQKSIFRPIHDGEDCTDIVIKIAAALAILYVVVLLLIVGWKMMQTTRENEAEAYRQELIQREADPDWRAAQKLLRKKHGYPGVIIYEPDKDPWSSAAKTDIEGMDPQTELATHAIEMIDKASACAERIMLGENRKITSVTNGK